MSREFRVVNDGYEMVPLARLALHPRNVNEGDVGAIHGSIAKNGFYGAVVAQRSTGHVLAGNHRLIAAQQAGATELPVVWVDCDDAEALRILLADNRTTRLGTDDTQALADLLQEILADAGTLDGTGYDTDALDELLADLAGPPPEYGNGNGSLAERFGVPPFSVLDARQGYWQERKRAWLALGIQSELGRGDNKLGYSKSATISRQGGTLGFDGSKVLRGEMAAPSEASGTSIFDPVLCELAYRWFCPPGGVALDPFAGGGVRGILASKTGRQYVGLELRPEQVEANREQAARICADPQPVWHVGDARNLAQICEGLEADFVFSCPPYADLERYSDDPRDLSTMDYPKFLAAYRAIISDAVRALKPDRFACFVVGEVRGQKQGGTYYGLVPDTVRAFEDAGARFYNEAILVTAVGSVAVCAGKYFEAGRKLGKTHQNVLVFVKGDVRRATEACGPVEVFWPEGEASDGTP